MGTNYPQKNKWLELGFGELSLRTTTSAEMKTEFINWKRYLKKLLRIKEKSQEDRKFEREEAKRIMV